MSAPMLSDGLIPVATRPLNIAMAFRLTSWLDTPGK